MGRKIVIENNGYFKVILDESIKSDDDSMSNAEALKQCKEMVEKYTLSHGEGIR